MIYYDQIKNEELRELVMKSESINSLPEAEAQAMIGNISSLPEEGQKEMIASLKEEQKAIRQAKAEKEESPENEVAEIETKTAALKQIEHDFQKEVREIEEGEEAEKTQEVAEDLLGEL